MQANRIPASEMNKVPISDFLSAMEVNFSEQVMSLRHYNIDLDNPTRTIEITVNTARNEWIDRNDRSKHGQLTSLLDHIQINGEDFDGNYYEHMKFMLDAYREMDTVPSSYPTATVRLGSIGTTVTDKIDDSVYAMMALRGISRHTVDKHCKQIMVSDRKTRTVQPMLAFQSDNDNWYAFTGSSWRPVTDGGISTAGEFKKNQYLYVYDNPLDYLAMMEKWHRNRVENAFGSAYHLILNGRQNIGDARQFIKDNPDFLSVKTFFPDTTDGRQMFAEIDDASKGTSVNCSYIFKGFESLSDQMGMRVPSDIYDTYLAPKKDESQTVGMSEGQAESQTIGNVNGVARQTMEDGKSKSRKNALSDNGQQGEKKKSDKVTHGNGPVETIILEPKHKWFGL